MNRLLVERADRGWARPAHEQPDRQIVGIHRGARLTADAVRLERARNRASGFP
jgi:hypothetical protein